MQLANRLFGVEVVSADGEAPVWHKDVRFFKVRGRSHVCRTVRQGNVPYRDAVSPSPAPRPRQALYSRDALVQSTGAR